MKLFKRNKSDAIGDKAAHGIAGGILSIQRSFSENMRRWSGSWNRKGQVIFLVTVCGVFVTLSVLAIVQPFTKRATATRPAVIKVVHPVPAVFAPRITEEEFQRIQQFKAKLDSSIIKSRPGLMDSIRMVEDLYNTQK